MHPQETTRPDQLYFRDREIPKLTVLLEIDNNFIANGRTPGGFFP
jgi:hypothetical protein